VVRGLASGRVHATDAAELRAPPKEADPNPGRATDIFDTSDSHWELARLREDVIAGIDSTGEVTEQALRAAAKLGFSIRTVFRWLALYWEAPQTSSLLPRPLDPPVGSHRLDERVERLITDVIRGTCISRKYELRRKKSYAWSDCAVSQKASKLLHANLFWRGFKVPIPVSQSVLDAKATPRSPRASTLPELNSPVFSAHSLRWMRSTMGHCEYLGAGCCYSTGVRLEPAQRFSIRIGSETRIGMENCSAQPPLSRTG
jgi:hypothetical protein